MSGVHNARCGLVSGIARGLGRPVLMLAEQDFKTPFDYRDLLYRYEHARDCADRTGAWLRRELQKAHEELERRAEYAVERKRSSELASLRLGEHVAENESSALADYFLDTELYQAVLRGGARLFVGRKGTGKTATLLHATNEFVADRRVLACSLRPSSYDLSGLERVMGSIGGNVDNRHFLIEAFWKYLLYSQMALDLAADFAARPAPPIPGSPEWKLDQYLRGPGAFFSSDFGVRIDRALETLSSADLGRNISTDRERLATALHGRSIADLRGLVGACLESRDRVAVLVDNLDATWDPKDDLTAASDLLLGLLPAAQKISRELERSVAGRRQPIEISVAVFLRSDIFERVRARAPEPDKISVERIDWNDEDALLRLVGERYVSASGDPDARPQELWERYFAGEIGGRSPSSYIVQRVVPRPRDIVFWCNAAIDLAARRGHSVVEREDLLDSEAVYSHHAVEALQVELGSLVDDPESLVHAFFGANETLSEAEVYDRLASGRIHDADAEVVLAHLIGFTFLGVQLPAGSIEYANDIHLAGRLIAVARAARQGATYVLHPAFRRYLEISGVGRGQQVLT